MEGVKRQYFQFEESLDKELDTIPLLVLVDSKIPPHLKSKINKTRIVLGLLVVAFLIVLLGYLQSFICTLLGFIYPAYASIRAIDSARKDDDTQWLTYWVVFGLFTFIEYFTFGFDYYFYLFKFFFILWLLAPITNGARVVHAKVLSPLFGKRTLAAKVDSKISEVRDKISEKFDEVTNKDD